ncbi:hypothetical protein BH23VER1_BH23VER1_00210 [soil metagenome]
MTLKPQFGKIEFARWEWVVMRILFALFVLRPTVVFHLTEVVGTPVPIGIAQFVDLGFLSASPWASVLPWCGYLLLGLYALGLFPAVVTVLLLVMHVLYGTLFNSQGAIHHTAQIVGYVLVGQVLCHLLRRRPGPADLIHASQQLIAAAYVVSGISKLVATGGMWVRDIPNIALQFEKNQLMEYYNTLVPPAEAANRGAIGFIAEHPDLARLLFGGGLALELFAVLALWNRGMLALFGIGLWLLHASISELMHLGFAYNKWVLAIFFINLPFWAARIYSRVTR